MSLQTQIQALKSAKDRPKGLSLKEYNRIKATPKPKVVAKAPTQTYASRISSVHQDVNQVQQTQNQQAVQTYAQKSGLTTNPLTQKFTPQQLLQPQTPPAVSLQDKIKSGIEKVKQFFTPQKQMAMEFPIGAGLPTKAPYKPVEAKEPVRTTYKTPAVEKAKEVRQSVREFLSNKEDLQAEEEAKRKYEDVSSAYKSGKATESDLEKAAQEAQSAQTKVQVGAVLGLIAPEEGVIKKAGEEALSEIVSPLIQEARTPKGTAGKIFGKQEYAKELASKKGIVVGENDPILNSFEFGSSNEKTETLRALKTYNNYVRKELPEGDILDRIENSYGKVLRNNVEEITNKAKQYVDSNANPNTVINRGNNNNVQAIIKSQPLQEAITPKKAEMKTFENPIKKAETKQMFSSTIAKDDVQKTFEKATIAKKSLGKSLWSTVKDIFDPVHAVAEGKQIKDAFREYAAKFRFESSKAIKNSEERMTTWEKVNLTDHLNFIHSIETGTPLKDDKGLFSGYKKAFETDYKTMQSINPDAPYRKNYFTHNGLWSDPKKAEDFYNKWAQEQFGGGKKFFKARTFPTVYDGLKAGLELKETNPEKLLINNHINVLKAKMADDFTKEMTTKGMPTGAVQAVVDRYMDRGLKNNAIYRTVADANSGLNMFQLGISAFHFTTTSINSLVSRPALALKEFTQGRFSQAAKHAVETPLSIFLDYARGSKAFKDNPELEKNIATILRGGGTVEKGGGYGGNQWDKMFASFRKGDVAKGIVRSPFALMEKTASPLMDNFVPRLKAGAYLTNATSELERLGKDATVEQQRRVLAKTWDSMDNRFGQLIQDNLLWNQTFKDILNVDTRSLGWNFGTIRELGGGVTDVLDVKNFAKALKTGEGISDRTAYAITLPLVTAGIATAIMKLHGQKPQSALDYVYPRTGEETKQGYQERLSIPGYMKDVFSYKQNPAQTIINKQSAIANVGAKLMELSLTGGIKDYFGNWVVDPYADLQTKSKQFAIFAVSQFLPFSVSGQKQRVDQSTVAKTESILGFQPAPAAITKGQEVTQLAQMWRDISPTPPKTPSETAAFDAKMQLATPKAGKTPEQAQNEANFLTKLRGTADGTPERAKIIQDYYNTIPESERKSLNYKLMLAGISTKGVSTSDDIIKGKPIYEDIQKIKGDQGDQAAMDALNKLSDEDYALYKKVKGTETAKETKEATKPGGEMEKTVNQVQDLIGQGKEDEAKNIVNNMNDADYRRYQATKKRLGIK